MEKPDFSQYPDTPGVYLYKDATGKIIYVGKARRLRRRIASYFRPDSALPVKTRTMLKHAVSLDILNTTTEKEALLLEASLIKKHKPRYNIILRDDKEYQLFRIGREHPFPRVEIVRHSAKKRRKDGQLFGPFVSGSAAKETWRLIHRSFPLRRCRDTAFKNRTRPCLYHDMGQCLGPCVLPVETQVYRTMLDKVALFLSGRSRELVEKLQTEMLEAAEHLRFEEAARFRDQIKAIQNTIERQSVVLAPGTDLDLIGVAQIPEGLALGIVFVRDGLLLEGRNFFWPALTVEDTPELLYSFIAQMYLTDNAPVPPHIIVPWLPHEQPAEEKSIETAENSETEPEEWQELFSGLQATLAERREAHITLREPRNQDEDRLVLLAATNAKEHAVSKKMPTLSEGLAARFHSATPVQRIEMVDISHTGGKQTKAGMVVFDQEEPVTSDYRVYNLDDNLAEQGAEAGDDYAALAIWAQRRAASEAPWPDLILIDGGKGQLAAVEQTFIRAGILKPQSVLQQPTAQEPDAPHTAQAPPFLLASIAKARNEDGMADRRAGNTGDRIFVPGRNNPLNFPPGCAELLFLQRVRDTAHDFVIGRHRQSRAAATLSGELTRLPGIGPQLARVLFQHFGSLAELAKADSTTLQNIPGIGKNRAVMLQERLKLLVKQEL